MTHSATLDTQFTCTKGTYRLHRLPERHHPSLRAWDAADEYLLQRLNEERPQTPLLLINDAFGALGVALHEHNPTLWYDNVVEADALELNLARNHLASLEQRPQSALPPTDARQVVVKLLRSSALLDWQLAMLNTYLPTGTPVLLGGMLKHVTPADIAVLEARLDGINTSRIVKKARVWHAVTSSRGQLPGIQQIPLLQPNVVLHNRQGVFSPKRLDPGAECLLRHLADFDRAAVPDDAHIVDLCCGSGVLGLAWLLHHPTHHLLATDASVAAVTSAELTLKANLPAAAHWAVTLADGLKNHTMRSADVILCNPPFHQADTVTTDVARQLFAQASSAIKQDGQFVVVGNRHLGYHQLLKNHFKQVSTISQDKRFVVLVATQPK
ncbi:MAG: methyltransferase [Natronospirillum sp.]